MYIYICIYVYSIPFSQVSPDHPFGAWHRPDIYIYICIYICIYVYICLCTQSRGVSVSQVSRLITLLERGIGRRANITRAPIVAGDVPMTFADVSHAREKLKYSPKVRLGLYISIYLSIYLYR